MFAKVLSISKPSRTLVCAGILLIVTAATADARRHGRHHSHHGFSRHVIVRVAPVSESYAYRRFERRGWSIHVSRAINSTAEVQAGDLPLAGANKSILSHSYRETGEGSHPTKIGMANASSRLRAMLGSGSMAVPPTSKPGTNTSRRLRLSKARN